ncbi:MAG: hypothetical protein U1E78_04365 [Gammaproteobacteria bacterium]
MKTESGVDALTERDQKIYSKLQEFLESTKINSETKLENISYDEIEISDKLSAVSNEIKKIKSLDDLENQQQETILKRLEETIDLLVTLKKREIRESERIPYVLLIMEWLRLYPAKGVVNSEARQNIHNLFKAVNKFYHEKYLRDEQSRLCDVWHLIAESSHAADSNILLKDFYNKYKASIIKLGNVTILDELVARNGSYDDRIKIFDEVCQVYSREESFQFLEKYHKLVEYFYQEEIYKSLDAEYLTKIDYYSDVVIRYAELCYQNYIRFDIESPSSCNRVAQAAELLLESYHCFLRFKKLICIVGQQYIGLASEDIEDGLAMILPEHLQNTSLLADIRIQMRSLRKRFQKVPKREENWVRLIHEVYLAMRTDDIQDFMQDIEILEMVSEDDTQISSQLIQLVLCWNSKNSLELDLKMLQDGPDIPAEIEKHKCQSSEWDIQKKIIRSIYFDILNLLLSRPQHQAHSIPPKQEIFHSNFLNVYPQQLNFRVGAERSRRRSVHKVHDCDENREGNNKENSAVKGIKPVELTHSSNILKMQDEALIAEKTSKWSNSILNFNHKKKKNKKADRKTKRSMIDRSTGKTLTEISKKELKQTEEQATRRPEKPGPTEEARKLEDAKKHSNQTQSKKISTAKSRKKLQREKAKQKKQLAKHDESNLEEKSIDTSSDSRCLEEIEVDLGLLELIDSEPSNLDSEYLRPGYRISVPDEAQYVLNKLTFGGFRAFIVGGFPRDALARPDLKPNDFDIVTDASEDHLRAELDSNISESRHIKGLYKFNYQNQSFDICVKPINFNLFDDALKRDLTVNAIYCDKNGRIYTTFYATLNDLFSRQLKIISINDEIENRFQEDPVKMLRVIQLKHKLSLPNQEWTIHIDTASEIRRNVSHLSNSDFNYGKLTSHLAKMFMNGQGFQNFLEFINCQIFDALFRMGSHGFTEYLRVDLMQSSFLSDKWVEFDMAQDKKFYEMLALLVLPYVISYTECSGFSYEEAIVQVLSAFRKNYQADFSFNGKITKHFQDSDIMQNCLYRLCKEYQDRYESYAQCHWSMHAQQSNLLYTFRHYRANCNPTDIPSQNDNALNIKGHLSNHHP